MTKRRRKPKRHHSLFGWWYIMINFPLVIFVKSGITGGKVEQRAKQVDRAAPGIPVPIFAVWMPLHYNMEQFSHRLFSFLRFRYYKGDGHSEWFLLPAAAGIIPLMMLIWVVEIWLLMFLFGWLVSQDAGAAKESANSIYQLIYIHISNQFLK
jgi:hypothetical protein